MKGSNTLLLLILLANVGVLVVLYQNTKLMTAKKGGKCA